MDTDSVSVLQAKLAIATERLRKSEERATAGQLALEVMHEIRNPLEALGHLAYLALEEAEDPARVRYYLRRAEEQIATLNQLPARPLASPGLFTPLIRTIWSTLRKPPSASTRGLSR